MRVEHNEDGILKNYTRRQEHRGGNKDALPLGSERPEQVRDVDLDTDPHEHTNVAYVGVRIAERNVLEAELDNLLA